MAKGLYIDARQLQKGAKGFERLIKEMPDRISDVLNAAALEIEAKAKRRVPKDRGAAGLAGSISADTKNKLHKRITANAPYAAYVEFGTGKYAAQEVSKLPPDYQAFAAQFKGKGSGAGFYEFVLAILAWIKRKGIVSKNAEYRVSSKIGKDGKQRTRKTRVGSKKVKFEQDLKLATAIVFNILKNGIHPHPFMLPAFFNRQQKLIT